ncbi:helix-turn-helix domain-containing protein [Streptomyces varsoviensis]|uniref:helix-turn-helix domain-containing protein n=1 Tax=Streptomyces varsoviensis TaxID=67373 RepID=UPI001FE059D1|nr:helix-turn-helix domain-containing protein [Streptomyces varsoviensis]
MRARIVELSWQGLRVPAIAGEMGCGEKTVRRWLHRFNRSGLEGLEDRGGQGRKRRITESERSRIVGLVDYAPPGRPLGERNDHSGRAAADGATPPQWTLDALVAEARRLGIDVGRSQVRRILLAEGVDWHRRSRSRARVVPPSPAGPAPAAAAPVPPAASRPYAPTSAGR